MAINIKNERVCELVREAAHRTGQPQTSVLEAALTRYLEELMAKEAEEDDRADEILAMIDAALTDEDRAAIRRDLENLYDENGLPA
ncbi:MAG: type II toxin-antitoxin system VapB family antitoxin [Actinomycetia bacterium]|nr:type II toxin-antitoxin system VapB family antitoxin [Actinomycetes bacterium]